MLKKVLSIFISCTFTISPVLVGKGYDKKVQIIGANITNWAEAHYYDLTNPHIKWNKAVMPEALQLINDKDDWSFGILHEIGHLFDFDNRWVFDFELFANFKKTYIYDILGAKTTCDRDKIHTKENITDFHCSKSEICKKKSELNNNSTALKKLDDFMVCNLGKLKEIIGWNPIKNVFRNFPSDVLNKFDLFMNLLSNESGHSIDETMSEEDYKTVIDYYNPN